jgi:hypothetical protein
MTIKINWHGPIKKEPVFEMKCCSNTIYYKRPSPEEAAKIDRDIRTRHRLRYNDAVDKIVSRETNNKT